ncbi:MAG: hypothetical protein SVK54_05835 [candidate division WOR-3 bacterium]|nr:hypothetical protein [candidate division WOR-3 bacterium]
MKHILLTLFILPAYTLTLAGDVPEIFARPLDDYSAEARRINDMILFDSKIYIGYGDYGVNTGPTDILYYDMESGNWHKEFTVDEEAVIKYTVPGGQLMIPGIDGTQDWELGNYYVYDSNEWIKKRNIPGGIHVFDIAHYNNSYFVSTGTFLRTDSNTMLAPGAVMSSQDGIEWAYEYTTSTDNYSVHRITDIIEFNDELYAFEYSYNALKLPEIPNRYHEYLMSPYIDGTDTMYLVLNNDVNGSDDCIVYNGSKWYEKNIIGDDSICTIKPFVFRDKLYMFAVRGKFVSNITMYLNSEGELPGNAATELYQYDSEKTMKINTDFDLIADVYQTDEKLMMLVFRRGAYYLAKTDNMKGFLFKRLDDIPGNPLSIIFDSNTTYIGTDLGEIYSIEF